MRQAYRARLGPLLARFFGEVHRASHAKMFEPAVQYAVAVKINLTPVRGFKKTMIAEQSSDLGRGLRLVTLGASPDASHVILQTPAHLLKSLVDRTMNFSIGSPDFGLLGDFRRSPFAEASVKVGKVFHDQLFVGNSKIDANIIKTAQLALPDFLYQYATAHDALEEAFQNGNFLQHDRLQVDGRFDISNSDLRRKSHKIFQFI